MRHVPVIIVGGGPVGMVLAISLAGFNVRTVLVNTESSSRWFPKGSTHNARTMEHYRRFGLARDLRKLGWELGRLSMPSEREKVSALANAAPTDQIAEPLFRCNQMYVEAQLLKHIQTLDRIDAKFGWRCVDLDGGRLTTLPEPGLGAEIAP